MRKATIERKTKETDILLKLNLDREDGGTIHTGCGFLDHMLELLSAHGHFFLEISACGDTHVDDHHLVEDVGICLGQALKEALGTKGGIVRYGDLVSPMDEALILIALDISGRSYLAYDVDVKEKIGTFDTELVEEFFMGLTRSLGLTLHIKQLSGKNTHHIIEGTFKGFGRALNQAVEIKYGEQIPSTKGMI